MTKRPSSIYVGIGGWTYEPWRGVFYPKPDPPIPLIYAGESEAALRRAALDAGVPLRDVQIAARHADPRTTTIYDRRRANFDRHAAYVVVAFVAGG